MGDFYKEINGLKDYFIANGYPVCLAEKIIESLFKDKFNLRPVNTEEKQN